jgi:microcystin degradation protein MlrC
LPRSTWITPGRRDYESFKLLSVAEAVARAKAGQPGDKPLVVADYTDNPGGGGYGDATAFLKGLVEAGVERVAFHAICDPEAVMAGMRAGIGMQTTIALGGKTDPAMGGGPLSLTGEVTHLSNGKFIAYGPMGGGVERDYGPSMVLRVGGIDIICITITARRSISASSPRWASTRRATPRSASSRCSISAPPSSRSRAT